MDDDEFGDLYTDVLRPLSAQCQESATAGKMLALSLGRTIDFNINSDDEEILYGAPYLKNRNPNPNSNPTLCWNLNVPVQGKKLAEPRGFDLNLGSNSEAGTVDVAGNGGDGLVLEAKVLEKGEGLNKASGRSILMDDDDDDDDILPEDGENKDGGLIRKEDTFRKEEVDIYITAAQKENTVSKSVEDVMGLEQTNLELSETLEDRRGSNFKDEWESEESEDDLQIVLNDNIHEPMAMERMTVVIDEDGETLVIEADNGDAGPHHHQAQMIMREPVWSGEGRPEADGEKDLGDGVKTSGRGVGDVASAATQPKFAYNNQLYHHPFHSQFKYVRPGAALLPAAGTGGIPGQVCPTVSVGPPAGRGRGDWRPAGTKGASIMQKGFHPGYGMPAWAANTAGRGYGSGLDFTLPSHKTIFEVDIDSFEDKPWKLPGIDVSYFFNFGLDEDSWRDYCSQLKQFQLEATMQKIRVYESGRMEQDYGPDPDLPPELVAAAGIQDIPSENVNPGMADAGPTDSATGIAHGRPSLPVGRPIPVETSYGDRLPSVDTRRPRFHDTDAIIEIICHSSTDGDNMAEREDNEPAEKDLGGGETDDFHRDDKDDTNTFSLAHNGQKREAESKRAQLKNTVSDDELVREDVREFSPGVRSHLHPDRESGHPHEKRSTKGRGHVRLLTKTASDSKGEEHITDYQNEEAICSGDGKLSPASSSHTIGSDREQALVVGNEMNDGFVMDDRSIDTKREEMAVDATTECTCEYGNSIKYSTKKQKLSSHAAQLSQHDDEDDRKGSKAALSSENRKVRLGSHRRFPDDFEDEIYQYRHPPSVIKKQVGDGDYYACKKGSYERDETGRSNMAVKGREDSLSRRCGDTNSSLYWHGKNESEDHGRRFRVEDPRKREHDGELGSISRGKFSESDRSEKDEHHQSRNQLDNGSSRGATNHDHDVMGSRQRHMDNNLRSRNENVDDLHSKRRKEEAHKSREYAEKEDTSHNKRESSSRRKRDSDDGSDQIKRDEQTRLQDNDLHYARQKEGASFQRERNERQRERDECFRNKQDEVSLREREESRLMKRIERAVEDKTLVSHSRGKGYKGSTREYNPKDVARHGDQFKRRDRVENGCFSHHGVREETYARGNQLGNDDKKAGYERPSSRDERVAYGSVTSRVMEHKPEEGRRKHKEPESGDQSSLNPSQRNHGGQISETVNLGGKTAQQSGEAHANNQSTQKLRQEEASSDDEQPDSKKGRSKLERWTSHKERDFNIMSVPPSSIRYLKTHQSYRPSLVSKQPSEESSKEVKDKLQPSGDEKDTGSEINVNVEVAEDTHLDTVEKLKKRSERFKLPMPSEKDALAIKKMESEPLSLTQTEICQDLEIKSERPARKRRWIGN